MEIIMTTRIHLDENRLMKNYEDLMDEIYLLYFVHPTNIPNIPLTESELAALNEYDYIAEGISHNFMSHKQRKPKKVYFSNDPDYSNGLPRR